MDAIISLDRQIFDIISQIPRVAFLDQFAAFLSGIGGWGVVWIVIAFVLFFREEKRDHWFFIPSFLVSVGGILSEFIVKNLIARPRPTDFMSTYSFPSSHAVLAFAFAYILSREEPKFATWLYILAILISLSRVYLGVHYPLDILAGAFLGIIIGWLSLMLASFAQRKLIRKLPNRSKKIR